MISPKSRKRGIRIRFFIVIGFMMLISSAVVCNVIDTTVISADQWNAKAMEELSGEKTIPPKRGDILASDGSVLATTLNYYTLRIDYGAERFSTDTLNKYLDATADSLARHFPKKSKKEWTEHLIKPTKLKPDDKSYRFRHCWPLLSNISYMDVKYVRSLPYFKRSRNRSGLTEESEFRRANPYGDMARRSIGGVGRTKECNELHGISGLEKALDSLLYGKPGITRKRALTREIVDWAYVPPRDGFDVVTTIDINIQDIVENELNDILSLTRADWGVAVVMDVATGDIKAISNLEKSPSGPGYIEAMNRAVLGYEPGSVVKTLSMLIALEDNIVTNLDEVIPTGKCIYMGRQITDSHHTTSMRVREVLEQSSNIAMTRIITRRFQSNPGAFYSRIKQLGFLEPMHTGIAGEQVPRIDSVPSNRNGALSLSRMCYGYATEIPPLYTLSLYNAIANGGRYVRPRLVSRLIDRTTGRDSTLAVTYVRDRICSPENASILRDMLRNVVYGKHGTGRSLKNDLVEIAGKTGTCYMIENGAYNISKKRLTFCGFFPADKPKYSCIVLTANPKENFFGAASTSGRTLKNIALKLYSRGFLGSEHNFADTHADESDANPESPVFTATTEKGRNSRLSADLGIMQSRSLKRPATKAKRGTVPDVKGLGLREATVALENAGYEVGFTGTGFVASMSPAAGTAAKRGTQVTLILRNSNRQPQKHI